MRNIKIEKLYFNKYDGERVLFFLGLGCGKKREEDCMGGIRFDLDLWD